MRAAVVVVIVAAVGCQGGSSTGTSASTSTKTSAKVVVAADAGAVAKSDDSEAPVDVGKAIADLGAVPAWQAVVDRAQYLARRGQHGVVYGTIAAPETATGSGSGSSAAPSQYVWLVDDTEGNGALAIRVKLGAKGAAVKPGDRVALGGAWALDDARAWYWNVDAVSPLPPAPPRAAKDAPSPPGHAIANGDLPAGTHPISKAGDGELVYFTLVGAPPVLDGDGWPVADELGDPVVALLLLPGERASYGAQDMRTTDERWHLKRGATYVVRVAVVHHHGSDKPATIVARTAPIRVG